MKIELPAFSFLFVYKLYEEKLTNNNTIALTNKTKKNKIK